MANVLAFEARPKELSESEALGWLRDQPDRRVRVSQAALAERWGWSSQQVARCLRAWQAGGLITRRGKVLEVTVKADAPSAVPLAAPAAPSMTSTVAPSITATGSHVTAGILGFTALCLAAIGLVLNAHFAASLGQTGLAAALLAAIGISLDVLAVALPTAASRLWQARHIPAALAAWFIWTGALIMMLLAGIGFASLNISDTLAGRAKIANESVALNARLERLRDERRAIAEHRSVEALETELQRVQPSAQGVWKATSGCRDVTLARSGQACEFVLRARENVATAQRRDAIDEETRGLERRLAALPAIRLDDPQARMTSDLIAWLSGGFLAPTVHDIDRMRLVGLTVAPASAGLLLWMAVTLWRRPLHVVGRIGVA